MQLTQLCVHTHVPVVLHLKSPWMRRAWRATATCTSLGRCGFACFARHCGSSGTCTHSSCCFSITSTITIARSGRITVATRPGLCWHWRCSFWWQWRQWYWLPLSTLLADVLNRRVERFHWRWAWFSLLGPGLDGGTGPAAALAHGGAAGAGCGGTP